MYLLFAVFHLPPVRRSPPSLRLFDLSNICAHLFPPFTCAAHHPHPPKNGGCQWGRPSARFWVNPHCFGSLPRFVAAARLRRLSVGPINGCPMTHAFSSWSPKQANWWKALKSWDYLLIFIVKYLKSCVFIKKSINSVFGIHSHSLIFLNQIKLKKI